MIPQIQAWDLRLFEAVHVQSHRDWLDPIFWLISCSALGEYILAGGLLAFAFKAFRPYVLPTLASALLSGSVICQILKHTIPRDRPSLLPISSPQEPFQFNSFPSGHTAAAFGVAGMLVLLTRKSEAQWVGNLAIVWALLVGLSRVYRGVHWPTDVLGGIFCGVLGASLVWAVQLALGRSNTLANREESILRD